MSNEVSRRALMTSSALVGALGFVLLAVLPASAQSPRYTFDIPAEPLGAALHDFAKTTGQQIIFTPEQVAGKSVTAIRGSYTTDEALSRMFVGTTLVADRSSAAGLMVQSKNVQAAQNDGAANIESGASETQTPVPESVVVSASRVSREGFVAPTPTTVLTAQDLAVGGVTNLAGALSSLPSFAPNYSQTVTRVNNNAGQNIANLRDLGNQRTLVLIDGARPVTTAPTPANFGFDLAVIPFQLIKRVEVVTGGASAQWGSDAVAGVINVVMDDDFEGMKADVQDGSDTEGYGTNELKADLAYGSGLLNGRGHVMFGVGYDVIGSVSPASRSPVGRDGVINNPNYTASCGCAQELFEENLLNNDASTGGLIVSGPLKGTDFGPGGSLGTFQYGLYGLNASSGALMVGGDPTARLQTTGNTLATGTLNSPLTRANFYGRVTYDLTSHTTLSFDLLANLTQQAPSSYTDFDSLGGIVIQNTNPYLPTQLLTAMAANNVTSFTMGRDNVDFGKVTGKTIDGTQQFKLGAKGDLDQAWAWDAFYSYGQTVRIQNVGNVPIAANFTNSINAIKSPTTGQPICAIALTNPSTTCVPIDLFGQGSPSAAALAYFEGSSISHTVLLQHEAAADLRGDPFSIWAGPVSIAAGIEFRFEGDKASADPLTVAKAFSAYAVPYLLNGGYTVEEGYLETVVPLVRDIPLLEKVDFNGAVRLSNYSTSGVIPSWKLGLTDNVTDELLLRGTVSRDIRAPNLAELNTVQTSAPGNVTNPLTNISYPFTQYNGGNPTLKPETAITWTAGTTYNPNWLSGLNLSLDYYAIDIKNASTTLTAQVIANQCYQGNVASACSEITTVNGAITQIHATYINLAEYKASGLDFEADYASDLSAWNLPGAIGLKWLATYVEFLKEYTGTTVIPLAGDLNIIDLGAPRWRSTFTANYSFDPIAITARARYVGGGAFSLQQTVNTKVAAQTYYDLGVQWTLPTDLNLALYANVDNLFNDVNPVAVVANDSLFDFIGRTYQVGIKITL